MRPGFLIRGEECRLSWIQANQEIHSLFENEAEGLAARRFLPALAFRNQVSQVEIDSECTRGGGVRRPDSSPNKGLLVSWVCGSRLMLKIEFGSELVGVKCG